MVKTALGSDTTYFTLAFAHIGTVQEWPQVYWNKGLAGGRRANNGCNMSTNDPAEIFRDNLRALIRDRGLTQRQAADEIGVDYLWLRKACANGISKPQERTKERIEKIRRFFGVGRTRLLWSRSLRTENRPEPALYSEEELKVAIESLSLAYRLNPRLKKVRAALRAIRRASTEALEDQAKKQNIAKRGHRSSSSIAAPEATDGLSEGRKTLEIESCEKDEPKKKDELHGVIETLAVTEKGFHMPD